MKNNILYFILFLVICSCAKRKADLIVINSNTYIVNEKFETAKAFAVKDGKFIAVGEDDLRNRYSAAATLDLKGIPVYPGLIDGHCHTYQR